MLGDDQLEDILLAGAVPDSNAPRLIWATVTRTSPTLVARRDGESNTAAVNVKSSGVSPSLIHVGDRVQCIWQGAQLMLITCPAALDRLESHNDSLTSRIVTIEKDTGWLSPTFQSGFSGLHFRVKSGICYWRGTVSGIINPDWTLICVAPSGATPTGGIQAAGTRYGTVVGGVKLSENGDLEMRNLGGPQNIMDGSSIAPYPVD